MNDLQVTSLNEGHTPLGLNRQPLIRFRAVLKARVLSLTNRGILGFERPKPKH